MLEKADINSFIKTLYEKGIIDNKVIATHNKTGTTGTTHYNRGLKINWLTILVKELFNNYEKYVQTDKWGRLGSPIQSWREWNYRSLVDTRNDWGNLLSIHHR